MHDDAEFIFVKADRRIYKIRLGDLLFIEGLRDYLAFQLTDRKIITRMSFIHLSKILPEKRFLRVSKSYIISKDKVDSFNNTSVFIQDYEILIGKSYQEDVLKNIMNP